MESDELGSVVKRLIKLAVSLIFFLPIALIDGLLYLLRIGRFPSGLAIYYHNVPRTHAGRFSWQIDLLTRRTVTILPDTEITNRTIRYSIVTFDDGFTSVLENALPLLAAKGIPSLMFVPSRFVGSSPSWVSNSALLSDPIMTEAELKGLNDFNMIVGSHGLGHVPLAALPPSEAEIELALSKAELEAATGRTVDTFSFPHGSHTPDQLLRARQVGYRHVFTISPRFFDAGSPPYAIGRVQTDPWDWKVEFFLKIHGAYCWMHAATSIKRGFVRMIKKGSSSP